MMVQETHDELRRLAQLMRDHIASLATASARGRSSYFAEARDDWNKLCVAMDTFEDALLALSDYLSYGLGRNDEERYLRLYGVQQAVFLQQDAIKALFEVAGALFPPPGPDSAWKKIRELRNLTSGHPIELNREGSLRRTILTRVSLQSGRLDLLIHDSKTGMNFPEYNLSEMLANYLAEAVTYTRGLVEAIRTRWPLPTDGQSTGE